MKKKHHPSHRIHGPNIFDPNCITCRKHGMRESKTENRHLLDENDPAYSPDENIIGHPATIGELARLYNIVRTYAREYGLKMCDLHVLAKLERRKKGQK
jgi:hypothetical protein